MHRTSDDGVGFGSRIFVKELHAQLALLPRLQLRKCPADPAVADPCLENVPKARYSLWTQGFAMNAARRTTKAIIAKAVGRRFWRWPGFRLGAGGRDFAVS